MNFTKSTLLAAGLLASTSGFSAPDPAAFMAMKEMHIANIQARLDIVQKHLSCVQAAQDQAAIKACHDAVKQEHKALAEKIKSQRADRKAQREAKKQAPAATPAIPATK